MSSSRPSSSGDNFSSDKSSCSMPAYNNKVHAVHVHDTVPLAIYSRLAS